MALRFLTAVKTRAALIKSSPQGAIIAQLQDVTEQRQDVRATSVSFETGEQTTMKLFFPYNVTIKKVRYFVTKALADTDVGLIDVKTSTDVLIVAQKSIPLSSALAFEPTPVVVAGIGKNISAGDFVKVIGTKTTAGGRCLVSLEYTINPS